MFRSLLQRLAPSTPAQRRKPLRRRLGIETLAKRELLAADLGSVAGTVYIDLAGNGLTPDDTRLESVEVRLYRDGGDGVFGGDDTLVDSVFSAPLSSDTPGEFLFRGLSPGLYYVEQDAATTPDGLFVPDPVAVTVVDHEGRRVQTIDAFDQTPLNLNATPDDPYLTDISAAPDAIGGVRKAELTHLSGPSSVQMFVDVINSEFALSSTVGTFGLGVIRYDGNDSTIELDPEGLGGANLSASDPLAGIVLEIFTDHLGNSFDLNIYSDANNYSTINVPYPAESLNNVYRLFVPFTEFVQGTGASGEADFTDVGAIELLLQNAPNQDVRVTIFESRQSSEAVVVDLQNFQPITLGNQVFLDQNNNGVFDPATESGIAGVDIELYRLSALGDVVNPQTQTPIATTTTDANGNYQFTNLEPGFYAAVIPGREFDAEDGSAGAGTLVGFTVSDPAVPTAGANAGVDNDADGRAVAGQLYVITETFQLVSSGDLSEIVTVNNTVDFGLVGTADLEIQKSFVSLDVNGSTRTATFRVDVTNNGLQDATGISVADILPAGLTFNSIGSVADPSVPPTGVTNTSVDGSTVTFDLTDLANGESLSFLIIVDVADGATGDRVNTVTVSGDQGDAVPDNNTSSATVALPATDLSITKTAETPNGTPVTAGSLSSGDTFVYRLVINNSGPDGATGVSVVDTLPADVTFVSAAINGGAAGEGITFDPATRTLTATIGNIANGGSAVVLITATVNAGASPTFSNTATVSNTPSTDPDSSNNTATVETSLTNEVDLAIQKTVVSQGTPALGGTVTYQITVTNTAGAANARGFNVTDTLPAGLTLVDGSFDDNDSGVTLSASGQALTFTGVPLGSGESVTFTFEARIAQTAAASLTNTAVVAVFDDGVVADIDSNLDNNEDDETIAPTRQVDLVVTKDDGIADGEYATPGEQITYVIVVTNTGTSDAVNVNVTDTLPPGVVATSITVDGTQVTDNNPDQGILSFVLPSVPTGVENAVTVLVTATIGATVSGNITNTVTISGGGVGDPAEGNTASVTTEVRAEVDVAVTKTAAATAVPGGQAITYTLKFVNNGPSAATNVNVADMLPAGLTLQSVTLDGVAVTNTGTGNNVQFVIPQLLAGEANARTAVITAIIAPDATGTLENTVTVTANGDTNPANNTSTVTTTLTPLADVGVTKTASAATAAPGTQLTYTIVVSNSGPSTAQAVTVTDVLPAGLTFVSGTGPGGTPLTASGQTITVNIDSLAPEATQTITIVAQINANFTGTITNPVTVATTTDEGNNTSNNSASASTQVAVPDTNSGSLSGRVFLDRNNNGIIDSGENGLAGITVNLLAAGTNTVIQTTTTDSQGNYLFDELPAGNYDIKVVRPPGLLDGLENPGDSRPVGNLGDSIIPNLSLTIGQSITSNDFGLQEALSKRRFLASSP